MYNQIHILKGRYRQIPIVNSVFTLIKPLDVYKGKTTAVVDASDLLGPEYSVIAINVEDYKLIK